MIKPKQNKELTTDSKSWAETKLQIVDLIEESFSNPRLEEMKSIGLRQMEILERDLQDEVLETAVKEIGVANFSKFLVAFGCFATIEDYYYDIENILDDEEPETFTDLVGEFIDKKSIDEINKIKAFLMLSKDSIINDFVIPNYKVSKSSHIWLEEQTERALNKAIDKHFNFVNHYNCVFDFVKYASEFDFETADHVSIFEYFMEGQDLQIELEIQKEIKQIALKKQREAFRLLEEEAKAYCLSPLELIESIDHADSEGIRPHIIKDGSSLLKYHYEVGDFWGYLKPRGLLIDLRSIFRGLDLQPSLDEIADFLQAFGLVFDGDAERCFYEAWFFLEDLISDDEEEAKDALYYLTDSRGHLLEAVKKWFNGEPLRDDIGNPITKSDIDGSFRPIFAKQMKKTHKDCFTWDLPNLFDVLTQEQLNEWETPFQNALKSADLSRIKASLEEEEVIDYLLSVFNREVYNWDMSNYDYHVITEKLEDWFQEFKILERVDSPLEHALYFAFSNPKRPYYKDRNASMEAEFCYAFDANWELVENQLIESTKDLTSYEIGDIGFEIYSTIDAVSDDADCLLTDEELETDLCGFELDCEERKLRTTKMLLDDIFDMVNGVTKAEY